MLKSIFILITIVFIVYMLIQTHIIFRGLKEMKRVNDNPMLRYIMYVIVVLVWVLYIVGMVYVYI
ncbi:hypothetical protein FAF33_007060 [Staphylococcus haemolyticus]|uniref:hypothetical protein n=1 Tax=Staphylococcus haemolyticus TaxID=1283 RepID=UPI0010BF1D4F|nr:hypothetical protein [Staphylococcus haemolyticus]TXD08234.1 hypothetical protein FAF33_007060 [Staphylococcus haemolyticus]